MTHADSGHGIGAWCWHERHAAPCRVVDREEIWGETAYRVWLPGKDAVVRARSLDLSPLDAVQPTVEQILHTAAAAKLLDADGFKGPGRQTIALSAEVKYVGQNSSLTVPFKGPKLDAADLADFSERFAQLHNHTFGYRSDKETLQIVSVKAVGRGLDETPRVPERARRAMEKVPMASRRQAYFGPEHGWRDTPVIPRSGLAGKTEQGPLIVEEYDTTVVVRPGWSARLVDWNNVVLERA